LMAQKVVASGSTGYDPSVGDLAVTHFYNESVEGPLVAGGADGRRQDRQLRPGLCLLAPQARRRFGFGLQRLCVLVRHPGRLRRLHLQRLRSGQPSPCAPGTLINPSQYIHAVDAYDKTSHELRIASPKENRLRFVAGLFWQEQKHDIEQRYRIDGLSPTQWVTGWEDTLWLTQQDRKDRDQAVFGEVSFDITDKLPHGGGATSRRRTAWRATSVSASGLESPARLPASRGRYHEATRAVVDKGTEESDSLGRFNLTYGDDDQAGLRDLVGRLRPGGINRRGTLPPLPADFLTNYEWAGRRRGRTTG
jgi:hypothetical protein